jgi:putative membrane protein
MRRLRAWRLLRRLTPQTDPDMDTRMRTCGVFATLSVAVAALAQTSPGATPQGSNTTQPQSAAPARTGVPGDRSSGLAPDRQFVERAAAGGVAEVQMGQLAQQKASSTQVKEFAARMVTDHTKANEELKQLAQAKGIAVSDAPQKEHHGHIDKLSKLSGVEFDRQYMAHMVSDHRKTVAEFQKASESAKDIEVKTFAGKTLPTLQDHLNRAQAIQANVQSASK